MTLTDPALALQKAIGTAATAAMTTLGVSAYVGAAIPEGQALPFVRIDDVETVEEFATFDGEQASCVATVSAYAATHTVARRMRVALVTRLTQMDGDAIDGFAITDARLEIATSTPDERPESNAYGEVIRIRYTLAST